MKKVLSFLMVFALIPAMLMAGGSAEKQVEDDNTYHIAVVRWTNAWGTDFTEAAVLNEMAEKAGINIVWDVYYNSDWAEQKALLLASGDLPDAFLGSISITDSDIAQNRDYFVDLSSYISGMPNLSRVFEEDPAMKALCTDTEGRIYSLPKKLPMRPISAFNGYINKTWLDNLGLEMPTTYLELENVLEAFVNNDPNGNGIKDEIGYTHHGNVYKDLNELLVSFGTQQSRANNFMGLQNGEPVFVPVTENFKEAVKWAHRLYEKGILPQEYFTQTEDMVNAKLNNEGGALTGLVYAWTADAAVGANADQFVLLPPIAGPDGVRRVESDPTFMNYSRNEFVITSACKNPEKLLEFADLFYDDLVSMQTFYGSIGDGKWKVNDNGTYELLIPSDGMSLDTSCWTYSFRDHGPKYMSPDFEKNVILPTDQGDGAKLAEDYLVREFCEPNFPVCAYTDEQLELLNLISTDIRNYVSQQYAHWVVDGGIDAEWDAYIVQLEKMGLSEYVGVYEDAYEFYLGN